MKKIIGVLLINMFLVMVMFAQEEEATTTSSSSKLTNKKGIAILPAEGDFAIGADALPFLNYLGNLFSGHDNQNSLNLNSMNIYGRYFLFDNTAIRANIYTNNGLDVRRYFVQDDNAVLIDPLSEDKVIDKRTRRYNDWYFQAGIQQFRGYGRLRGFYGFTIGYGQSRTKYEYQYGNEITEANQSPTSRNFSTNTTGPMTVRPVSEDYGISRNFLLGPVCGVEYYFTSKMCIGAEANIIYTISKSTESDEVNQEWANGQVIENTIENAPGNLSRNTRTSGLGAYGGLYVMFHF